MTKIEFTAMMAELAEAAYANLTRQQWGQVLNLELG